MVYGMTRTAVQSSKGGMHHFRFEAPRSRAGVLRRAWKGMVSASFRDCDFGFSRQLCYPHREEQPPKSGGAQLYRNAYKSIRLNCIDPSNYSSWCLYGAILSSMQAPAIITLT